MNSITFVNIMVHPRGRIQSFITRLGTCCLLNHLMNDALGAAGEVSSSLIVLHLVAGRLTECPENPLYHH